SGFFLSGKYLSSVNRTSPGAQGLHCPSFCLPFRVSYPMHLFSPSAQAVHHGGVLDALAAHSPKERVRDRLSLADHPCSV
ncbi:hypothetical protein, partial [Halopseudomonas formosensis]